jgi:hypothetical protein
MTATEELHFSCADASTNKKIGSTVKVALLLTLLLNDVWPSPILSSQLHKLASISEVQGLLTRKAVIDRALHEVEG